MILRFQMGEDRLKKSNKILKQIHLGCQIQRGFGLILMATSFIYISTIYFILFRFTLLFYFLIPMEVDQTKQKYTTNFKMSVKLVEH